MTATLLDVCSGLTLLSYAPGLSAKAAVKDMPQISCPAITGVSIKNEKLGVLGRDAAS